MYKSRIIQIGNLAMGGNNPIRIQSMTNTDTMNTRATVTQVLCLVEAGCELVRITAPGIREAENLYHIKNELLRQNCLVPLVADIHYNPKAAEIAAAYVEKIRINPGNYTDRNNGKLHYSDKEYQSELNRIADKMQKLIEICKQHQTVIRIGTNHGSLSERIMGRYGDTPLGMATSAIEFAEICQNFDFHDLVFSMKASNVKIMTYSTRLFVQMMLQHQMNYPIHLGVTEAGDAEQGRIKSAAGIGTLILDGIGDTLRVSLTEDPIAEIPVAKQIVNYFPRKNNSKEAIMCLKTSFQPRETLCVGKIGESIPVVVSTEKSDTLSDYHIDELHTDAVIIADINEIPQQLSSSKPIIAKGCFNSIQELQLKGSAQFGRLLIDGSIQGICSDHSEIALDILQAVGSRVSKAEFISCPSCGRTQYDIQQALQHIKKKTSHLKGIKIGVMGCIVNGPGEMADAHYGYVGSGAGKITLYKGKNIIRKNIDTSEAVEALIQLIKDHGDWIESDTLI